MEIEGVEIKGITYDSRQIKPGDLFVAIRGEKFDGYQFIQEAIKKGAVAIVSEMDFDSPPEVKKILVPDSRIALAQFSAQFYDYPSRKLTLIGITGTKGKTTTTYLIDSILRTAGYKTGFVTTIDCKVGDRTEGSKLTTPEASDLQSLLSQMVKEGVTHAILEVSSHSLVKQRVLGCEFDGAIFMNLSHDHLDFHRDFQSYFGAKKLLFDMLEESPKKRKCAILNRDDDYGALLYKIIKVEKHSFALKSEADLRAKEIEFDADEMRLKIDGTAVKSCFVGEMNAYNILAAWQVGLCLGIDKEKIKQGIEALKHIPGRMEKINAGQPFSVIVDFAHSPASLEALLMTVRRWKKGRLILVFGCPGERDREKRPMMGALAAHLADYTVLTTDDPYFDDPIGIISEIEQGFKNTAAKRDIIPSRLDAIAHALKMAKPDDVVVIAGRGHEKYQPIKDKKIEFDDRVITREILSTNI
ncbi:MAG: UDP-N-acetylmuramoyl-L-alanyl-D-glutamate--2,6-diaminopimelate ligase [Candidatus Saganbacteria bacterium]|nr:UDP-N-acetylmuramoyl-L-alanyl-D-glutamate--2,6-diaminopimelate ligase [Candidatus Saganbacteria bacterium]